MNAPAMEKLANAEERDRPDALYLKAFHDLQKGLRPLVGVSYAGEEEARGASERVAVLMETFVQTPDAGNIVVELSGEGVRRPNVTQDVVTTADGPSIIIKLDAEQPMTSVDFFEHVEGTLEAYATSVIKLGGVYQVQSDLIFTETKPSLLGIDASIGEGTTYPLIQASVRKIILAHPLMSSIEIQSLREHDEREQFAQQVAQRGLRGLRLKRDLDTLETAMYAETPSAFVPLKKIKLLRDAARATESLVETDSDIADVITNAWLRVFDKGRPIKIMGTVLDPVSLELQDIDAEHRRCKIVDVVFGGVTQEHTQDQLLLVVESAEADQENTLAYYPMRHIDTLEF